MRHRYPIERNNEFTTIEIQLCLDLTKLYHIVYMRDGYINILYIYISIYKYSYIHLYIYIRYLHTIIRLYIKKIYLCICIWGE